MQILILIFAFIGHVHSARILALFGHTGKSHQVFFEPLLKTLAERGHDVTVASFFPNNNPLANYKDVSFEGIAKIGMETFDIKFIENLSLLHSIPMIGDVLKQTELLEQFGELAVSLCEKTLNWPPLIEALKAEYDLVIVESFTSDCMLGLLHVFAIKAPIVALSSSNIVQWALPRLGIVDNPSYLPVITAPLSSNMTFLGRMQNTFMNLYLNRWFRRVQEREQEVIERYYDMRVPLYELSLNLSLVLVNTFYPLNGVRNFVPGLVEVGGMHLNKTRQRLPKVCDEV